MDAGDFSFETLSKQEAIERKQPRLTKFEANFWDALQGYLRSLESSVRKEQERNPTSRKIALLQDELRNASRKAESLWEARERKITLHALKNAREDGALPPENILAAEKALYDDLVRTFRTHVPRVVQLIEAQGEGAAAAPAPKPAPAAPPAASAATAPPPAPAPSAPKAPASAGVNDDQVTVRALVDVPPFVGMDGKTYRLKKGDVLTLPRRMVEMLSKRGQVAVMA